MKIHIYVIVYIRYSFELNFNKRRTFSELNVVGFVNKQDI